APTNAIINSGTGEITWTPTESQDGTHAFRVRVKIGSGATRERGYDVLVHEVDDAPKLAVIADQEIEEGESLNVAATGTDVDEIAGIAVSLTYSLVTAPTNAIIDTGTGVITWTPGEEEDGTHAFRVRVSDGSGATAEGEFEVLVQEVNELPELAVIADQEIEEGESL